MNSESQELIEIYKLHVEMVDRVSQRRGVVNQLYITILSALIGVLTLSSEKEIPINNSLICFSIGLLGIIICILWITKIHAYKQLNSAKFRTLEKIEEKLPFQFYKEEWTILKSNKKYKTLTTLEKISPIVLSIPFFLLIVYAIITI